MEVFFVKILFLIGLILKPLEIEKITTENTKILSKNTFEKHKVRKAKLMQSFVNFVFFIKLRVKKLSVLCGKKISSNYKFFKCFSTTFSVDSFNS